MRYFVAVVPLAADFALLGDVAVVDLIVLDCICFVAVDCSSAWTLGALHAWDIADVDSGNNQRPAAADILRL